MNRIIDKDKHLKGIKGALPRTKKTKKRPKPANERKSLQPLVDSYLLRSHHKFFRIPDSVYRSIFANPIIPIWVKRDISAYLKGLPDVLLFKADNNGYNQCAFLELKSPGRKQNKAQRDFADGLNVHVSESVEDAIEFIEGFYD